MTKYDSMPPRREKISITLEREVLKKLDEEVAKIGTTRSQLINQLLRRHLGMEYMLISK